MTHPYRVAARAGLGLQHNPVEWRCWVAPPCHNQRQTPSTLPPHLTPRPLCPRPAGLPSLLPAPRPHALLLLMSSLTTPLSLAPGSRCTHLSTKWSSHRSKGTSQSWCCDDLTPQVAAGILLEQPWPPPTIILSGDCANSDGPETRSLLCFFFCIFSPPRGSTVLRPRESRFLLGNLRLLETQSAWLSLSQRRQIPSLRQLPS